jgi:hypothetical protein
MDHAESSLLYALCFEESRGDRSRWTLRLRLYSKLRRRLFRHDLPVKMPVDANDIFAELWRTLNFGCVVITCVVWRGLVFGAAIEHAFFPSHPVQPASTLLRSAGPRSVV